LDCELTFQFLQFKIHLNLKSDDENERFYEKCKDNLIKDSNNFDSSMKACFNNILVRYKKEDNQSTQTNMIIIFMTDYVFVLTIIALLSLFGPVSLLICNHYCVASKLSKKSLLLNNTSKRKSRIVLLKAASKFIFIYGKSRSNEIDQTPLDDVKINSI
jgi:hypothetical protein